MKPNELRIGNILQDEKTGCLLLVSDINLCGFTCVVLERDKVPLPDGWKAAPIPLTEEWLLKLGFKYQEQGLYYIGSDKYDGYYLARQKKAGIQYFKILQSLQVKPDREPLMIQYVHQLQNLYFVLTGTELECIQESNQPKCPDGSKIGTEPPKCYPR